MDTSDSSPIFAALTPVAKDIFSCELRLFVSDFVTSSSSSSVPGRATFNGIIESFGESGSVGSPCNDDVVDFFGLGGKN